MKLIKKAVPVAVKAPKFKVASSIVDQVRRSTILLSTIPLVLVALVVTVMGYTAARSSLSERVAAQLTSLRSAQAAKVSSYFESLSNSMLTAAGTPSVVDAAKGMIQFFPQLGAKLDRDTAGQREAVGRFYTEQFAPEYAKRAGQAPRQIRELLASLPDETVAAQYAYIAANSYPVGRKSELQTSLEGSDFSRAHSTIHEFFGVLQKRYGFYDLFVVDPVSGMVVYSFFKEIDFGTSLLKGPYSQTALAKSFDSAIKAKKPQAWMSDYEPYFPSYEGQATFMSVPIFEGERIAAVLIAQVPIDRVNKEMTFDGKWEEVGLGRSGETYLVGSDSAPRSISRQLLADPTGYFESLKSVLPEAQIRAMSSAASDVGIRRSDVEGVKRVLAGETAVISYKDALGTSLLASIQPIKVMNQQFGLIAEMQEQEALAPLNALLRNILLGSILSVLVVGAVAYVLAGKVSGLIETPINTLKSTVEKLQSGDFAARARLTRNDELGQLGGALDKLLDDRLSSMNQATRDNEALNNSVIDIMQVVGTIAMTKDLAVRIPVGEDITGAISDALNMLTDETGRTLRNVSNVSNDVAQATAAVQLQSQNASHAANREQVEVERAASELSGAAVVLGSMAERAKVANQGAERAVAAAADALSTVDSTIKGVAESRELIRETEKKIKRLGERSQEIGQVVTIIQAIAERTGILALNASMHAASAGEAGRSFAVVADEVKRLSESAREATGQIGRLVTAIQTETGDTVATMNLAITRVVDINRLADEAGRQMLRNQQETEELARTVRDIARTSAEQALVGAGLQERARIIQEASGETVKQLNAQSEETEKLVLYAKSLLDEVSVFKLPA